MPALTFLRTSQKCRKIKCLGMKRATEDKGIKEFCKVSKPNTPLIMAECDSQ